MIDTRSVHALKAALVIIDDLLGRDGDIFQSAGHSYDDIKVVDWQGGDNEDAQDAIAEALNRFSQPILSTARNLMEAKLDSEIARLRIETERTLAELEQKHRA